MAQEVMAVVMAVVRPSIRYIERGLKRFCLLTFLDDFVCWLILKFNFLQEPEEVVSKDLSKLTKKEKLEVKKLTLIHNAIQN